jgi:asparagine synthase (glutamine-hydrolysing)
LFSKDALPYFSQAEETYQSLLREHPVSFAVFKQAPWHHYGLLALEETQVSIRSPYLDNEIVKTVFRAPQSSINKNDACLRLIEEGNAALRQIPTDRGGGGKGLIGMGSQKLGEFFVKAEYAYDYGMPQWLAYVDHWLTPLHLERLFLGRHKFNHYRLWYRGTLRDYICEVLLDARTLSRPYLDKKKLESVVHLHLSGHRNYTNEIHTVLSLEFLHRLFID